MAATGAVAGQAPAAAASRASALPSGQHRAIPRSPWEAQGWSRLGDAAEAAPRQARSTGGFRPRSSASAPSLRLDADRSGWIPLQVSWLNPRETNPVQNATDTSHQAMNLEQVMRSRMQVYDGTPEARAKARLDAEAPFQPPSSPSGRRRPPCIVATSGALFLRPQKGMAPDPEAPCAQLASVNHAGSPVAMHRPWTTSVTAPSREDPEEPGSAWHPLITGVRPWAPDRDEEMQQLLRPGKTVKRFLDSSTYGGIQVTNAERNVFYMTLRSPSRPQVRGFFSGFDAS